MPKPNFQYSLFNAWEYQVRDPDKPVIKRKPKKKRGRKRIHYAPKNQYDKYGWLQGYIRKIVYADGKIDYVGGGDKQKQIFQHFSHIRQACDFHHGECEAIGAKQYIVPARIVLSKDKEIEYVFQEDEDEDEFN